MSDGLTPPQLDEIEATAKKATPGEWRVDALRDEVESVEDDGVEHRIISLARYDGVACIEAEPSNLGHIAMMDPATTLALVAEVRELRAKVERVRGIIGPRDLLDPHQGGCEGLADETLLSILDALGEEA